MLFSSPCKHLDVALKATLVAGLALLPARQLLAVEEGADRATFSVDLRERATYVSAIEYDNNDPRAGWFWTQRLNVVGDFRLASAWSARVALLSALQEGGDISPVERNNLAVQEGFVEYSNGRSSLRLGRQEIRLGSQRLVGWRDGTNVRRTWDGVRYRYDGGTWQLDAIGLQLVDVETDGAFNDSSDDDRVLAGIYATTSRRWTSLDIYYLYSGFDDRATIQGTADQRRHSIGARVFGDSGGWFWNWEAVYQFGDLGADDISAWTLATNTGYRFDAAWSPSVMLSVNVASGDDDPADNTFRTFDALYPRGSYFSELAQLGPANFFNLNPYLSIQPVETLSVTFDLDLYWRLETADGVYAPPGNIIRRPAGSPERFVNSALSAAIEWEATETVFLGLSLTYSRPEAFLEDTGPADDTSFAEFTFEMNF